MRIWVDADACPKVIKEILYRAAVRTKTTTLFIANQPILTPSSPYLEKRQVAAGFDMADQHIITYCTAHDLIITADIPLADAVITKNAVALNPRGEVYSKENIKQRLALRDFNAELRSSGIMTGGPAKLSPKEIQLFANALDILLR